MKTSRALSGAALALALALPWAAAQAEEGATNLNFTAGRKALDDDDWDSVDDQTAFGAWIDHEPEGWWLGATVGVYNGTDDAFGTLASTGNPAKVTSDTWEFAIGPKKVFKIPGIPLRAYVGGGYAYMTAELKIREHTGSGTTTTTDTGSGDGYWASTGAFVTLAEQINLGVEARYSSGDVEIGGTDLNAGGTYVGGLLGFHF